MALALIAAPAPALAQAYQCAVPQTAPTMQPERPDEPPRRLKPTAYTLALSWSPEFCKAHAKDRAHRMQCGGELGRFGFIVHGLWPEAGRTWPQWCAVTPVPQELARGQLCRTPAPQLLAHAWAKHGSCMTSAPAAYFAASNVLADNMRYPDMERLSRQRGLTAGDLREALALNNPGRPANSFGLLTSRTGWLREVFVCLDRRFRPARCPAHQFGPRDSAPLKIWRGL